jgi:hypothetical protein
VSTPGLEPQAEPQKKGRRAGITCPRETVVNLLDTQIALVEANQGIAPGPPPKSKPRSRLPASGASMFLLRSPAHLTVIQPTPSMGFYGTDFFGPDCATITGISTYTRWRRR